MNRRAHTIAYVSEEFAMHWKCALPKEALHPFPGFNSPAPNDGNGSLAAEQFSPSATLCPLLAQ